MNDMCVGELKYRSSVEGVDHNIHVVLEFYSKAVVQESAAHLKCSSHTDA